MKVKETTISSQMKKLFIGLAILTVTVFLIEVLTIVYYQLRYQHYMHNLTTASEFNQNFKEDIDLKMYYYVIGSKEAEGLPMKEVGQAKKIAEDLISSTANKDSKQAITSVIDLCGNLEDQMREIEFTASYDQRQILLKNNIYVLTSLIEEYMYRYLYCEAVLLNSLQDRMNAQLTIGLALIFLGVAALFTVLLRHSARISRSIAEPIENLSNRVQEIGGGDLTVKEPVESQVYEVSALSEGVEQMVEKMGNLMKESTDRQESLRQAELALLQAQINPHFLYNTLDTIIWLIEAGKTEEAEEMVTDLSSFFRHSLSNGEDVVTLDDEEKQIRSYLQIQQFRYKDIMDYSIDIDPAIKGTRLPKLTIQPLVENALYHGVKLKRAKGFITVTGKSEGDDIVITVSDTGAGMTKERLEELRAGLSNRERVGFGLSTVDERLKLFFGEKYGLSIESTEGEGTDVTVRIPASRRNTDET